MPYIPYPRLCVALAPARRPLFGVLSLSLILSFLVATQPGSSLATSRPEPVSPALTPSLADLPITFVPNVGQSDADVQFQAQGLGGMLFFTPDQIVLSLPGSKAQPEALETTSADSHATLAPKIKAANEANRESVVRMRFLGANPAPAIQSIEQLPGIVNYVLGNDAALWRTNVPTYGALRYEQLYPGVDLRYDGAGGRLKGTYLVAAGANPSQIRWHYDGVTGVQVDDKGDLVATLPTAEAETASRAAPTLREAAPIAWQIVNGRQVPVEVRYNVHLNNTIGFVVGAYDRSLPLVLDPTLDYSTYVGDKDDDEGRSIAVDATGAIYIIGNTNSISFPGTNNGSNAGGVDTYITKLDPQAATHIVYTTYLGGNNNDLGSGIALGSQGIVHVTGSTYSTNFPTSNPNIPRGGAIDAFVTTLNISGTMTYSAYLGGSSNDFGNGIALDSAQNLYLTGRTESNDFPVNNGRDTSFEGAADAFITKLAASDRSIVYSTYLGGNRADISNAIAVDSGGTVVVTGQTSSDLHFPTLGSARPPVFAGGLTDAFVTKLSSSGQLVYSIYLGGSGFDEGMSVAIDGEGRAYVTGTTQSLNFPTANSYEKFFQGRSDAFFSTINVSGSMLERSTYLGGTSDDSGQDIVVDDKNAAYIIGSTKSSDFPNKDAIQSTRNGDIDAFVTKFQPTGSAIEYSTYFGGTIDDYGYGITSRCVSDKCTAYITGTAKSRDFPTIEDSWKPNYSGGQFDAFVAQFGSVPTGPRIYVQPPMKFIGVNQTFSVDVLVDSAEKDIDTVDAYLEFNKEYLEVVDAEGNATDEISPTLALNRVSIYNHVDNTTGQIEFSATKIAAPADGAAAKLLPRKFTAAKIHFRTKKTTTGAAPTTISFIRKGARHSDLYLAGAARTAALSNSNIRILSGALLNGKISLEQRGAPPNAKWTTPLYRGDNNGIVVYDNRSSANTQALSYFRTDTDNNGRFSVFLRNIEGGNYDIQIKGADTLSNIRRVNLQSTDEINFGTLCVGDSSGDDVINGADISYIVPFIPSDDSLPNFPTEGDANKDKRINREDLNIIKGNFLETGLAATARCTSPATRSTVVAQETPASTTPAQGSHVAATEPASISLYPEEQVVVDDNVFTVSLKVDLKSNLADTIDVYLNASPSELIMLDKQGNPISGEAGSLNELDLHLAALNNSFCEINYNDGIQKSTDHVQGNASITCFKQPFLPNTFTLGTFAFKPTPTMKQADITLTTEGEALEDKVRTTSLYKNGVAINASRLGATVVSVKLNSFVYAPIVGW